MSPAVVESPVGIFREEQQLGWIHFSERGEFLEADLYPGEEQAKLEELIEAAKSEPHAGGMDEAGSPSVTEDRRLSLVRLIRRLQAEGYSIRGRSAAIDLFPADTSE